MVLGLTFDLQIGPVARDNENTSPATQSLIDEEIKKLLKVSYEEEEKRRGTLYWVESKLQWNPSKVHTMNSLGPLLCIYYIEVSVFHRFPVYVL